MSHVFVCTDFNFVEGTQSSCGWPFLERTLRGTSQSTAWSCTGTAFGLSFLYSFQSLRRLLPREQSAFPKLYPCFTSVKLSGLKERAQSLCHRTFSKGGMGRGHLSLLLPGGNPWAFGNHPAAAAVLSAITALGLLSLHRQPFAGLQVEDQQLFLGLPSTASRIQSPNSRSSPRTAAPGRQPTLEGPVPGSAPPRS